MRHIIKNIKGVFMCSEFMKEAINQAKFSLENNEVPVGAVIVKNNKIIAAAHNEKEKRGVATAHAEILAIEAASKVLGDWRLNGCSMYVTLEPCPMCAGAILQSRISELHIGTFDDVAGACGSVIDILGSKYLNSKAIVKWYYCDECSNLLSDFFKNRR